MKWNLPPKCRDCTDREDLWCKKFQRSIFLAWRSWNKCDLTDRNTRLKKV